MPIDWSCVVLIACFEGKLMDPADWALIWAEHALSRKYIPIKAIPHVCPTDKVPWFLNINRFLSPISSTNLSFSVWSKARPS